jgi:hypothetical protein
VWRIVLTLITGLAFCIAAAWLWLSTAWAQEKITFESVTPAGYFQLARGGKPPS